MILNANGEASRFASFGLPMVADSVAGFAGPLAGEHAGTVHGLDCNAERLPAHHQPRHLFPDFSLAAGTEPSAIIACF
jgi:molybdopterin-guanine dinucleotide biosynthesis protein A